MERVKFNKCLNLESKAWNVPIFAIIGMGLGVLLGMIIKGAVGLAFGGAIGFGVGRYLSYQYHNGNLQRWAYWHLAYSQVLGKRFPPSNVRHLN